MSHRLSNCPGSTRGGLLAHTNSEYSFIVITSHFHSHPALVISWAVKFNPTHSKHTKKACSKIEQRREAKFAEALKTGVAKKPASDDLKKASKPRFPLAIYGFLALFLGGLWSTALATRPLRILALDCCSIVFTPPAFLLAKENDSQMGSDVDWTVRGPSFYVLGVVFPISSGKWESGRTGQNISPRKNNNNASDPRGSR
ncbi:hypothetical protein PCANC_12141 [Puccinia coronata f. sp. avenae]|uniref:Uncharacterized protein n=1 Tax=Puccinia coronata f. sp. avenae TaxID=200324 RepID=A0A2N5T282_9BASI|nr:hypothetical protein PCANC_14951 [Puccinia coronata f. sp. avenae]PLW49090.1 hypothetical protein PCANC_12141 [Puccinia coronata f. sp. avenae]